MDNSTILLTYPQKDIANVVLNRPHKHNAFDEILIRELTQVLANLQKTNDIRVLILSANGKNFSAGADLSWMQRMAKFSIAENLADATALAQLFAQLNSLDKPTIALAQGATYGGGIGLVACCDIAIAGDDAQFCFSEVKLGLAPATISPYVVAAIGARAARRYCLTAEQFDAQTAQQLGLIHQIVANENLTTAGLELARQLTNNGPNAIRQTKQLLQRLQNMDNTIVQETIKLIAEIRSSPEGQEGITAFLTKRKANWQ